MTTSLAPIVFDECGTPWAHTKQVYIRAASRHVILQVHHSDHLRMWGVLSYTRQHAGPSAIKTLPHDAVQPRCVSPPQERRSQTEARYGHRVSVPESGDAVRPGARHPGIAMQPYTTKQPHIAVQQKTVVEKSALWAERRSMWLPYDGAYVQVVADAVVDVLRHPHASQLVKHRNVPVMILSSAAETAAAVHFHLRYSCLEARGSFQCHKEELDDGGFQHLVPVVMLQACRPGTPGTNDVVLEDIDALLDVAAPQPPALGARPSAHACNSLACKNDPPQHMEDQHLAAGQLQASHNLNQQEVIEAHEQRTPPPLPAHRC